jgi:rod shape-determining protein MreD
MKKAVFYMTVVLFSLVAEVVFLRYLKIGNVTADLFLILTAYFALKGGCITGMNYGFFSSLVQDAFLTGPFGINPLLKTIIGWIVGGLQKKIYGESVAVQAGLVFICSMLYYWGMRFINYLFRIEDGYLFMQSVLFSGYNALVAVLIFPLISFFMKKYVE